MPQGLQVWDTNEGLTVDITTRLTRVLGSFTTTEGVSVSGSVVDDNLLSGQPWYTIQQTPSARPWLPLIAISGNTISWEGRGGNSVTRSVTVVYGVY